MKPFNNRNFWDCEVCFFFATYKMAIPFSEYVSFSIEPESPFKVCNFKELQCYVLFVQATLQQ